MATINRTYMIDDLDQSEDEVSTVQFALDRVTWEIDLSTENAARLREKLARFVDAATLVKAKAAPAKRGTKPAAVRTNKEDTAAIREWAQAAGLEVSARGRIAKATQEAYDAAH